MEELEVRSGGRSGISRDRSPVPKHAYNKITSTNQNTTTLFKKNPIFYILGRRRSYKQL
jgi:hypothetical protein